jgi:hypothetical protein
MNRPYFPDVPPSPFTVGRSTVTRHALVFLTLSMLLGFSAHARAQTSPPDTVRLLEPAPGVRFSSGAIATFRWTTAGAPADSFEIEVADLQLGDTPAHQAIVGDTVHVVAMPNTNSERPMVWRVRAHNADGWGPFGEDRSIVLIPLGSGVDDPTDTTADKGEMLLSARTGRRD